MQSARQQELQGRNEELSRVNSDLINLVGSVQIAIVIVAPVLLTGRMLYFRATSAGMSLMTLGSISKWESGSRWRRCANSVQTWGWRSKSPTICSTSPGSRATRWSCAETGSTYFLAAKPVSARDYAAFLAEIEEWRKSIAGSLALGAEFSRSGLAA